MTYSIDIFHIFPKQCTTNKSRGKGSFSQKKIFFYILTKQTANVIRLHCVFSERGVHFAVVLMSCKATNIADPWIPHTNGPVMGKAFSWNYAFMLRASQHAVSLYDNVLSTCIPSGSSSYRLIKHLSGNRIQPRGTSQSFTTAISGLIFPSCQTLFCSSGLHWG